MCKSTLHHSQEWSHQEPREVVRNSSPKSFCRHRRLRFSQTYALRHTAWPLHPHVFHIVTLRDIMSHHQCAAGGWNSTASRIDVVNMFQCPVAATTNSQTQKPRSLRPTWKVKMKRTEISPTPLRVGCHPPHHNRITSETNNHSRYYRTRPFTVVTLDCSE